MKALLYRGIKNVETADVPEPEIRDSADVIVKVSCCAVCGSDMHVYHGRETGLDDGTVMGHEFCGEVVETGSAIKKLQKGDLVVSPFTTNCGSCYFCRIGLTSRCEKGALYGWVENGSGLHGGQAEYVRVPMAESTLVRFPKHLDPAHALLTGDILSTGWYAADRAEIRPGTVHVVIGCGPVGLMAVLAAKQLGATKLFAIDPIPSRRKIATLLGADSLSPEEAPEFIATQTKGRGADSAIEAVGSSAASRLAFELLRPGGIISTVGVHTAPKFSFAPPEAYDKNLDYRIGRSPARFYMEKLLLLLSEEKIDVSPVITHRMSLDDAAQAYALFDKKEDDCLKIILEPNA